MIDALIAGKLYGKPTQRTGASGKPFVTGKLRAATSGGDVFLAGVIAFSDSASAALLALDDGDSVAISGSITPKVWTGSDGISKPGLDLVAHVVTTIYHTTRKRKAMQEPAPVAPGAEMPYDEIP